MSSLLPGRPPRVPGAPPPAPVRLVVATPPAAGLAARVTLSVTARYGQWPAASASGLTPINLTSLSLASVHLASVHLASVHLASVDRAPRPEQAAAVPERHLRATAAPSPARTARPEPSPPSAPARRWRAGAVRGTVTAAGRFAVPADDGYRQSEGQRDGAAKPAPARPAFGRPGGATERAGGGRTDRDPTLLTGLRAIPARRRARATTARPETDGRRHRRRAAVRRAGGRRGGRTGRRSSLHGRALLAGALGAGILAAAAVPAQAAGYRYWSFWERANGAWTYAQQGPAVLRPVDGDVLGFRFSVSENSGDAAKPRGPADFEKICGTTEAADGTKRIALAVDFGTAEDAPGGERPPKDRTACARVAEDATAADALAATMKPLRYDSSALLCAIAGYPGQGCGEQVSADGSADTGAGSGTAPEPENGTSEGTGGGGTAVGVGVGTGVVVALAAGAYWQARRRRD